MATGIGPQIDSLDKLMKILKDDVKRGKFLNAADETADAEGVKRNLPGIQDTIDDLKKWSGAELKKLADLNDLMFNKGLKENSASTTMVLAKQV